MSLTAKVLLGMALGILLGTAINIGGLNTQGSWINIYLIEGIFDALGKMFIAALKMLVVPLVFFSLISGVVGIGDINKLGKIGIKSFLLCFYDSFGSCERYRYCRYIFSWYKK